MSDKITIELTRQEAEDLLMRNNVRGAVDKLDDAIAAHDRASKRAALGLPWSQPMGPGPVFITNEKGQCAGIYNGAQWTLMASAPDLAEALEGLLNVYGCDAHTQSWERAREALRKAGW